MAHAIAGDTEGAKEIQEEFGEGRLEVLESVPVVGHGIAAGYAIAGDDEKAQEIALGIFH